MSESLSVLIAAPLLSFLPLGLQLTLELLVVTLVVLSVAVLVIVALTPLPSSFFHTLPKPSSSCIGRRDHQDHTKHHRFFPNSRLYLLLSQRLNDVRLLLSLIHFGHQIVGYELECLCSLYARFLTIHGY